MQLHDIVHSKANPRVNMTICGFATREQLIANTHQKYALHIAHFRGSIPPELEDDFGDKAPSDDAVFCVFHEPDENHPRRVASREKADKAVAAAHAGDAWKNHPVMTGVNHVRSGVLPLVDHTTPEGALAIAEGRALAADAHLACFGYAKDVVKMSDAEIKKCALAFIHASHTRDGYIHAWFKREELVEG